MNLSRYELQHVIELSIIKLAVIGTVVPRWVEALVIPTSGVYTAIVFDTETPPSYDLNGVCA